MNFLFLLDPKSLFSLFEMILSGGGGGGKCAWYELNTYMNRMDSNEVNENKFNKN